MSARVAGAIVTDVVLVLVFATIGRRSHAEGLTVPGLATTAWPFVAALALGWSLARGWRRPTGPRTGAVVWVVTVVGGMVLRRLSDTGTALPFVLVATVTLGSMLVGWRALWSLVRRWSPAVRG